MKGIGPRAAFQPPSDMLGDGGGSSTSKKIFIGLGIGCGAIMLILGLLFAAGAFKAVTCCNEVKGIAESSVAAEKYATEFTNELYRGDYDAAYARTTPEFQARVNASAFASTVQAHAEQLKSNAPRVFNVELEQHGDADQPSLEDLAKGTWVITYQFAGPTDETMLLLDVRVAKTSEEAFGIADIRFDERVRNLAHEPPAEAVLEMHDHLQRGQYEFAYTRLGDAFRTSTDREAWRKFLDDVGPVLTSSKLEIREVSYNDANTQATVMAHAQASTGQNAIIQFELQPVGEAIPGVGWRIVSIAPLLAEDEPQAAQPPAATNGSVPGSTNGGPEVEAEVDAVVTP